MDDRVLALSVTLTLALLLAITIPLCVILPQKLLEPLPINVLVPLYMKPEPGAWDRLYNTVAKHADTNFTIVVNPDNGPGSSAWPGGEYVSAMKRLNEYPNLRTLGYVNTTGGSRDEAAIRNEVARYARWSNDSEDIAVHGIFFDKTPFRDEHNSKEYLKNISATVRLSDGFGHAPLVVHNPGCVPDKGLMAYTSDLMVIFEGAYDDLLRDGDWHKTLAESGIGRHNFGMLIHSVPNDIGRSGVRKVIEDVRRGVESLYLTGLDEDAYAGYGSLWEEWLDLVW